MFSQVTCCPDDNVRAHTISRRARRLGSGASSGSAILRIAAGSLRQRVVASYEKRGFHSTLDLNLSAALVFEGAGSCWGVEAPSHATFQDVRKGLGSDVRHRCR